MPEPVSVATLNQKSLYLTRPGLAAYAGELGEYRERAADVFDAVRQGVVQPKIGGRFPLAEASRAHQALEDGQAGGAVLLRP